MPNPGISRPRLITSILVNCRASCTGGYQGATNTLLPSRAVVVTVAATVIAMNGSRLVRNCSGMVSLPA